MKVYCFVKRRYNFVSDFKDVILSLILVNAETITILNFTIFSFGSKKEC
ncbi:hypothetical protein LEP1GSC072_3509 [Leptospira noguchii str. Bonito]|nr:hypothetical protein LEP1GSC072_3509 [Leptospira noguchii str. Bonito]